ncbi:MAG TPA: VIT and VWA domain-containing protein, partial [Gemmataceae bacterium]|nr:VIT and VWA domain-containing protein [Gemmataceae bacterium]
MNTPEPPDDDKPIADLLAAADRDAPMPDRAFLDRLREQSTAAFSAAATPLSLRKRIMLRASFRWVAACAAAVLVLGIVVAQWVKIMNPVVAPPPDDKFVVENGLVDDGRIGKVSDAQGVVAVKPVLAERWSPVQPRLVLKPGDWLRTDSRGANAVAVKLLKSVAAIVGPHSTVELVKPTEIRLLAGELELSATEQDPVELHGPDKQTIKVTGKQHYRVEKDKLVKVEQEPLWLQGFKGTTANESIGSLIATVDGRNVPLTVGYHHVTVEIRDQIARTTIEESFVNRTKEVLEGVFHFPLPQDASISGFGMWIGNQLVEADVVEKQRAREIYETILREKRDPGLLEWAGGNIFKARVYPIPGLSEKRIKISYTQVLPLQGNRYRYSYALQSEMLKAYPLRDLKIDVKVNSATPLKAVSSPTHPARVTKTDNSGHVEFTAQEYTPSRDFEAVVEVAGRQSDVVVIPHRRGDDGYFLVQLTPPGAGGDWDRPLVPNGDPLKLLVLADTSASMDRQQRSNQRSVIASLLGSLTPKDAVNLAACDVGCDWAFDKPRPATPQNLTAIGQLLDKRSSLGWTDLDKAFASALAMCEPGTHVVYVGDGIVTTGDADAVAFAKRVQRLHQGKPGTFHAVATGSSFEPLALKAIASLGGGSFRRVSGEKGPTAAAIELLTEIATPTLRDLKVEFVGFQTARVYPESLPNVAAGTQQILLGRYLPTGKDQSGEIVVTGTLGGKPVRFASKVSLADAEAGNSFIPRLWARMHLDKLLEQGVSEVVKQDIIALSEEFNIITPYTSLLVLESDADRERFAVKRRFQMRDGEKFFAEGRENAMFELKQKQMRQAGSYRTELRRAVLAHLTTLGRNPNLFSPRGRDYAGRLSGGIAAGSSLELMLGDMDERLDMDGFARFSGAKGRLGEWDGDVDVLGRVVREFDLGQGVRAGEELQDLNKALSNSDGGLAFDLSASAAEPETLGGLSDMRGLNAPFEAYGLHAERGEAASFGMFDGTMLGRRSADKQYYANPYYWDRGRGQSRALWIGSEFPTLPAPPAAPKEPKSSWPANAVALSKSLLRTDALGRLKGGVVVTRQSDSFDTRNELSSRSRRLELVSPTAWLGRTTPEGGQVLVNWCDAKERGVFTTAFHLGRVRPSEGGDLSNAPLELADYSTHALHHSYSKYAATVEVIDKDRSLLILKPRGNADVELRYLIDTTRRVLLSIEHRHKGKVTSATRFEDFVEVAGSWWARRVESLNDNGQRTSLTTQTVAEVPADEFTKRMAAELAGKAKVLFLKQPLPKLSDAKAAVAAGKATFDDRATLALHFAATQQWARAREHVEACEKLAAGKSGMRWLSSAFLLASRRHEELRKRILEDAAALAATADPDALANDYFLAEYLFGQAQQVCQANEQLAVMDQLRKSYDRQPAQLHAVKTWRLRRVSLLQSTGQPDKALAAMKDIAADFPRDSSIQYQYAQHLANAGAYAAAYAWITRTLESKWDRRQEVSLRDLFAGLLYQQGRYRELADYLTESIKLDTESEHAHTFYLSALVRSNQAARAETLAAEWIRAALKADGELTASTTAKLNAAVRFALGDGYQLSASRVEEKWHATLAEVALHFARRGDNFNTANTIIQHHRFHNTDAGVGIRKGLADELRKNAATLSAAQIEYFVQWAFNYVEGADREKLAADLRKGWDAERNQAVKHQLAQQLSRLLHHINEAKHLAFLRVQWQTAADEYRSTYAKQLFEALLSQP